MILTGLAIFLIWLFVYLVLGSVIALVIKLLGGEVERYKTVIGLISLVVSVILYRLMAGVEIGGTKPFKEKIKREKRKYRFKKVNHKKYYLKRGNRTYIGYDRMNEGALYLSDSIRNRHIHILGSTGSGKSVLLFNIFKQDVERGMAVIFIDAKGDIENLGRVKEIVRGAGREKDLLYFLLHDESNTYNPLVLGNATQLKDKIISSIRWSEVYYQRVSENILQLLFSAVKKILTLKNLYDILSEPEKIYDFSDDIEASREYIEFVSVHKKEKTTLTAEIGLIVFSDFYKKLDVVKPDINFFECINNNKVVYFGIDVQSYQETSRRIGRMITEDINTTSGIIQTQIKERERRYVSVIIDEFQAFGTENFINCLSRGRSSGFMITIAHQSLADLEMIKKNFSKQVIDNTYTKIVLPINDPETIQTIADMIGTQKELEETVEVIYSRGSYGDRGTLKLVDEYIIHPNDIRRLRIGEAVYKSGVNSGILQIPVRLG